jgi:hypothetical protein
MMRCQGRRRVGWLCCGVLFLCLPPGVWAHHILGIPHYAYDEQYPQTPVLTYRVDAGANELKMTGYPGPGTRASHSPVSVFRCTCTSGGTGPASRLTERFASR